MASLRWVEFAGIPAAPANARFDPRRAEVPEEAFAGKRRAGAASAIARGAGRTAILGVTQPCPPSASWQASGFRCLPRAVRGLAAAAAAKCRSASLQPRIALFCFSPLSAYLQARCCAAPHGPPRHHALKASPFPSRRSVASEIARTAWPVGAWVCRGSGAPCLGRAAPAQHAHEAAAEGEVRVVVAGGVRGHRRHRREAARTDKSAEAREAHHGSGSPHDSIVKQFQSWPRSE